MKFCQYCGAELEGKQFCTNCGQQIVKKKKKVWMIVLASISLVLGLLCFIPQIYLANNYYKIAGAQVSAKYGDYSELNFFRSLETISEVGLIVGIVLCLVCVSLLVLYFINRKQRKDGE